MANPSLAARAGRKNIAGVRNSAILPAYTLEICLVVADNRSLCRNHMIAILIEEGLRSLLTGKEPHQLKSLTSTEFDSLKTKLSQLS